MGRGKVPLLFLGIVFLLDIYFVAGGFVGVEVCHRGQLSRFHNGWKNVSKKDSFWNWVRIHISRTDIY